MRVFLGLLVTALRKLGFLRVHLNFRNFFVVKSKLVCFLCCWERNKHEFPVHRLQLNFHVCFVSPGFPSNSISYQSTAICGLTFNVTSTIQPSRFKIYTFQLISISNSNSLRKSRKSRYYFKARRFAICISFYLIWFIYLYHDTISRVYVKQYS